MTTDHFATSTLAATASDKPARLRGGSPAQFVSFRLDRRYYALPLDHVERALRMVATIPVFEAPPWVAGVINFHGRVIPVVDLRQRFGQPPREPHPNDRLLVVRTLERTLALMVDEVTEVLEVPGHQVEPPPDPVSKSRPLSAVIRRDEGLILVLDATRLLPPVGDTETQHVFTFRNEQDDGHTPATP